jgi:hypothetical protein
MDNSVDYCLYKKNLIISIIYLIEIIQLKEKVFSVSDEYNAKVEPFLEHFSKFINPSHLIKDLKIPELTIDTSKIKKIIGICENDNSKSDAELFKLFMIHMRNLTVSRESELTVSENITKRK